ncbi:hypothetical protein F2Q70_00041934 [Brassica cretica]|uniref:Uncharacterized protein n=1 Tax=Brassica cretica TaxID=69181 RepID=A0A8S9K732_BRACR|nr:hypothetical protein F2Q70_00041934 [Brassica cretica]
MNEHSSIPPQPTDKTLNLEASLCLNGFKEAAFGVWRQKQAKHKLKRGNNTLCPFEVIRMTMSLVCLTGIENVAVALLQSVVAAAGMLHGHVRLAERIVIVSLQSEREMVHTEFANALFRIIVSSHFILNLVRPSLYTYTEGKHNSNQLNHQVLYSHYNYEHSSIPPQPTDKTLNLEASLCLNGFKEAGFASVETEASQAYVSLKMGVFVSV